jgi:4-amino-4-deoxy-L-arabinose transferase-like glycosyltransferase
MLALRRHAALLALVPLAWLVLFHGLGRYGAVDGDEIFYHDVAVTMVETGNWLRLDFHGEHRLYDTFMNAPIQYWLRALVISAIGDGRVAMRLPSALFGLASVGLSWALARWLAGSRAAFLAAAVQLTTFQFVYWHGARTGELETAVAFTFSATAFLFLRYLETGRGIVLHHLCWALLANWKLPLGLLPLLAEGAAFAALPAARARVGPWLRSALFVLPLGLGWHLVQLAWNLQGFLEVVQRMLSQAADPVAGAAGHGIGANLRFYAFAVLYGAFPWSLLYPFALVSLVGVKEERGRLRFALIGLFVVSVFVFFAGVQKHYRWYWTPALPLLSVLVGAWLDRMARRRVALSALAALAVVAAGIAVMDVDLLRANPFAGRTVSLPIVTPPRSWLGGPPLGEALWITTAALFGGLVLARLRPPVPGGLAALLFVLCFGIGALRVLSPLQHLDTRTEMVRVREAIDADRAAGRALRLPIAIHEGGELKVRALFARDFEIVPGRGSTAWWLLAPGDPRAVTSIRHGPPAAGPAP